MHINDFDELIDLDRRAVVETMQLVCAISPDDLTRPTPCAGWTVDDLLAHMTGQQIGFAAAARGHGENLALWAPSHRPYLEVCVDVLTAFGSSPDVQERGFALPEIRDGGPFSAPLAISFHLVDSVVHAWDLAVSIGAAVELDADVLSAALRVAEQVPNGAERLVPGAAFAPGRDESCRGDLDRILVLLGRDPAAWPAVSPQTA
ncbi:MAG TPA: TIGR03086 family metal-binding protein [Jatrophihabitantaceae bacterium]|nr:TIGR03086 family metal-binding protein [Jatrophihabitantaceae bacterium]